MTLRRLRALASVLALCVLLAPGLSGCTTNPATGEQSFTPFMSPSQEMAVGAEEHPKILAEYGGAYRDSAVSAYVSSIGRLLAATTETPNQPFTFTVLDTPDVNAFAVPGGYVYVTRGLMALANNEAELAGVIAHEIGHVVARHAAQRHSQAVLASIGLDVLGAATGSSGLQQLAGLGAQLYLLGYSREQELEADRLGVRYLARAGYDPMAMASFLSELEAEDALDAKIAEKEGSAQPPEFLRTHPRTETRIVEAANAARRVSTATLALDRDVYLQKIDGLVYGDSAEQGFVKGRVFEHPRLLFRFEAPPGFRLRNGEDAVVGEHANGAKIVFTSDDVPEKDLGILWYLVNQWAEGTRLEAAEEITVNGMRAATGRTRLTAQGQAYDARLVAIRFDRRTIYRFLFLTPPGATTAMSEDLRRTTYSFRRLSESEAAALKPTRIAIVTVRYGDTQEGLASRMAVDEFPLETFRVLNGLKPGQPLELGAKVKLVVE